MSTNDPESWQRSKTLYVRIVYMGGALALVVLITTIVVKNIMAQSKGIVISPQADPVLFEILTVLSGAVFGSAIVGSIFHQYEQHFGQQQNDLVRRHTEEGILRVFRSANDPALLEYVSQLITRARSEMVFIGLGLGLLSHNRSLLVAIADQLNKHKGLRVSIYVGNPENRGVQTRIEEENTWHSAKGMSYDSSWITRYPAEISSVLSHTTKGDAAKRFHIKAARAFPMLTVIKIDDVFLYFPYGSPNIRGSESPWVAVRAIRTGNLAPFLQAVVDFFDSPE